MNFNNTTRRPRTSTILLLTLFALTSCLETRTSDAKETFKYWAGTNAPDDLEILGGQYWQSAHWTREYIVYLKFISTEEWWSEFLRQNNLSADKDNWTLPIDAPAWFMPSDSSIRYRGGEDFDQGSRFFRDTTTGVCYIYEIQL